MNQFEKIIKKPISEITYDELKDFYNNEEFLEHLNEYRYDVSKYVMENSKDKKILDDFRPLFIESLLLESQSEIGGIFKEEKTKENLISALSKFEKENDNWEARLSLYLLVASEKLEYPLPPVEEILPLIEKELDDLEKISMTATNLLFEGLDLLYILQQSYFEVSGVDLLKGNERVRAITNKLNEDIQEMFSEFQKSAEEQYPNLKPEDIGYIDITKLKGGENN